jgi:hypothetical protein
MVRTSMRTALLLLLSPLAAHAAPLSPADYQGQLSGIRQMLSQCIASRQACDSRKIGPDDVVSADPEFQVHWDWLRAVVDQAADGKPADSIQRQQRLADAASRVESMAAESGPTPPSDPRARAEADRILAQPEFRHVHELSWWDRLVARFWQKLSSLFSGLAGVGPYVGWLVPVLEWGTLLAASVGLILWARRVLGRQRLAIALEAPKPQGEWQERSRQWAESARRAADAADWREAVHALYWASVVELEGRNVWRQHRGRTPREYLRLLDLASPYRPPIAQMTTIFERIWYGLRPAAQEDYARVHALYEAMRSA